LHAVYMLFGREPDGAHSRFTSFAADPLVIRSSFARERSTSEGAAKQQRRKQGRSSNDSTAELERSRPYYAQAEEPNPSKTLRS
jgi:hypothetical protein